MTHRRSESRLGEARAYHPRGRTVRERDSESRGGDPFRSALRVFDEPTGRTRPGPRAGRTDLTDRPAVRSGVVAPPRQAGGPTGTRTGSPGDRTTPAGGRTTPAGGRTTAPAGRTSGPGGRTATAARAGGSRTTGARSGRDPRPAAATRPRPRPARARRSGSPPRLANGRQRLRLATALALAMFAVLGLRLVEMQVTDGQAYAASGLQNRLTTVTLPAARGAIYDREGSVLAHSVEARFVYADPVLVTDPDRVAAALQPLLGISASELRDRMRPRPRPDGSPSRFEWLARGVDIAVAEQIQALNLPGIGVDRDERRIVPGNDLAANLIGFTGADLTGLEGLEAYYDELLRGVDGQRTYESGQGVSAAREIPGGYRSETPPRPGSDLYLTIDMDLQYEVQRILAEHLRAADASFGAAVVLDPRTGEVLAQASYPTFNAADPLSAPPSHRVDAATSIVFDPGSTHKPLVIGAALEEGVVERGELLAVNPTIRKGDQTFSDTTWHPPGTELTLAAILAFSSNVGTIMIADRLGSEKLYEYQQRFGLGTPTGVGLPHEATGALLPPDQWYGSSYGSVPIGHSVDVTTLQLAAAYGAIANDGVWVQPRLIQAVAAPDGTRTPTADPTSRRVLSSANAAYLRELLEAVVTAPGGTGQTAAVPQYRVAGKTGTGKLVVDGEYAPGEVATFVGMAPANAPRYVIAVAAHTPAGGGGMIAGPVFRDMMAYTLSHYQIPPAADEPPTYRLYR